MNNENSTTNAECDITGSIRDRNEPMPLNDITREKVSGIYKIINKVNGKYYVGSSINLVEGHRGRWYEHRKVLRIGRHFNIHLQRAWNKYGEGNFQFIIVDAVPIDILNSTEQLYLNIAKAEQDKCYNLSFDVDAPNRGVPLKESTKLKLRLANLGKHPSEETRRKMSLNRRGKPILKLRGRKLSPEHIEKLRNRTVSPENIEKLRNRIYSEETRQKMSKSHTGMKLSDQAKHKLSISRMGSLNPNFGKKPSQDTILKIQERQNKSILQLDINGCIINRFASITVAAKELIVNAGGISRVCSGEYKHTHGLYFKFAK